MNQRHYIDFKLYLTRPASGEGALRNLLEAAPARRAMTGISAIV